MKKPEDHYITSDLCDSGHRIKPSVGRLRISDSVKFILKKSSRENLWIALVGFCCVVMPWMFYWDPWFILDETRKTGREVFLAPERQNEHSCSVAASLKSQILKESMLSCLKDKVQICVIKIGWTLKGKKTPPQISMQINITALFQCYLYLFQFNDPKHCTKSFSNVLPRLFRRDNCLKNVVVWRLPRQHPCRNCKSAWAVSSCWSFHRGKKKWWSEA